MPQGIFTLNNHIRALRDKAWCITQPTLVPFSSYQGSFNDTNQTISHSNTTNLQPGAGDFTIEAWINTTYSNGSLNGPIAAMYTAGGAGEWIFGIKNQTISIWIGAVHYPRFGLVTGLTDGIWHHIAWVRSGSGTNNNKVYLDGNQVDTFTNTVNLTGNSEALQIGAWGSLAGVYSGYMSNLRIVKGTAVYTNTFNPPTSPLTAISGTQLLTLQDATVIDNSSNTYTMTNNNAVAMSSATVNSSRWDAKTAWVEYLVVAGGGGGGYRAAGGGGGGGLLAGVGGVASGSAITITVGAGGSAGSSGVQPTSGGTSVLGSISATGGGAAGNTATAGSSGGSGGGGGNGGVKGTGITGQGNNGSDGGYDGGGVWIGGAGGGAGTVGLDFTTQTGGNGGAGIASAISGTVTTYAGGGGAGIETYTAGLGGVGGGGNGSASGAGSAGAANTGGGGGGGFFTGNGGAGGSGIVIIRYPDTFALAASSTGSPTITTAGGWHIYAFTSSGSITI